MRAALLIAVLLLLAAAASGCGTCERRSWCEGDVQHFCNVGSESEPSFSELACEAPAGACVELGPDEARCVHAPAEPCEAGFVDRCEGSLRVYCDPAVGHAEAVDCAKLEGSSGCGLAPESGLAACL